MYNQRISGYLIEVLKTVFASVQHLKEATWYQLPCRFQNLPWSYVIYYFLYLKLVAFGSDDMVNRKWPCFAPTTRAPRCLNAATPMSSCWCCTVLTKFIFPSLSIAVVWNNTNNKQNLCCNARINIIWRSAAHKKIDKSRRRHYALQWSSFEVKLLYGEMCVVIFRGIQVNVVLEVNFDGQ